MSFNLRPRNFLSAKRFVKGKDIRTRFLELTEYRRMKTPVLRSTSSLSLLQVLRSGLVTKSISDVLQIMCPRDNPMSTGVGEKKVRVVYSWGLVKRN